MVFAYACVNLTNGNLAWLFKESIRLGNLEKHLLNAKDVSYLLPTRLIDLGDCSYVRMARDKTTNFALVRSFHSVTKNYLLMHVGQNARPCELLFSMLDSDETNMTTLQAMLKELHVAFALVGRDSWTKFHAMLIQIEGSRTRPSAAWKILTENTVVYESWTSVGAKYMGLTSHLCKELDALAQLKVGSPFDSWLQKKLFQATWTMGRVGISLSTRSLAPCSTARIIQDVALLSQITGDQDMASTLACDLGKFQADSLGKLTCFTFPTLVNPTAKQRGNLEQAGRPLPGSPSSGQNEIRSSSSPHAERQPNKGAWEIVADFGVVTRDEAYDSFTSTIRLKMTDEQKETAANKVKEANKKRKQHKKSIFLAYHSVLFSE
ncbi:Oidioi.mRNA.OKI2018_I69.YSR.g17151.t1.cds [Oikopleura dioica]|uniref:Oidioi.mRNA.OKI2018_I69.YSR.g17151.t1.cds n=1 Tax=Oikopleura dioica TaxID=34765 RepID=A0ABN7SIB6_OIKDI|nr:Oidioi.mRNA.OKI2018_I69.YSR.g17151.t1.cds [Oikopleura dioica]